MQVAKTQASELTVGQAAPRKKAKTLDGYLTTRSQFIEMIKVTMEYLPATEMNVIFSMREEFFGQFQREFEKIIRAFLNDCARINIEPLSLAEAWLAIIKPLALVEAKIGYDEDFVDHVLLKGLEAEGEQKGINLPHLQIVCNQKILQTYSEDFANLFG